MPQKTGSTGYFTEWSQDMVSGVRTALRDDVVPLPTAQASLSFSGGVITVNVDNVTLGGHWRVKFTDQNPNGRIYDGMDFLQVTMFSTDPATGHQVEKVLLVNCR